MRRLFILALISSAFAGFASIATAQGRTTYTGTVISYGTGRNVRTSTYTFTLNVNGTTSESDINRYVSILQEGGQDELRDAIDDNDLGRFALTGRVGQPLNAVVIDNVDGRQRIRAVYQRWLNFGELRGGYRSVDYPFGYIELFIDPRTGRGEGSLIEAAQIRWRRDRRSNQYVVEIENFATFPSKLLGVVQRNRR